MDPAPAIVVVGWFALHLGALGAAWATRVAAGARIELLLQLACFSAMIAVGFVGWLCHEREIGLWILSGITLVAMVITAVIDFRRPQETQPVSQAAAGR